MNPDPPTHDDAQDESMRDLRRRVSDIESRRAAAYPGQIPAPTEQRYIAALENQLPELVTEALEASELIRELRRLFDAHAADLAYAHRKRLEDEHAAWAWQQIKRHAPWVGTLAALIASVVGYLATHSFNISSKP
jgi:hypothetical protein